MTKFFVPNKYILLIFIVLIALFSTLYAKAQQKTAYFDEPLGARITLRVSNSYRIGVGDLISLSVYPQEEYSASNILVRSDGKASFPKIGVLSAAGKSVEELTAEINKLLNTQLRKHFITIGITSTRSAIFYLTGAVNRPGPFQMVTNVNEQNSSNEASIRQLDMGLSNVLSNAGGVKLTANLSQVQIRHSRTGEVQTVNLWKVLKEGASEHDPWLDPGDTIFIPELPQGGVMSDQDFKIFVNSVLSPRTFPVRVIGEVHNPSLVKIEGETPLLSTAIAMAGGYAPQALKTTVAVRRFTDDNHFTTLFIDTRKSDFILRPNDIVYVGETKMYQTGRFMQKAAQILAPFSEAAIIGGNASQMMGFGGWRKSNWSQR